MSEQHIALRLADEMVNFFDERGPDAEAVAAELRRLHAEVEEQCRLNGMGSEREARLMAENKALRADAERYRWLRKAGHETYIDENISSEEDLDAAIDAAKERT